MSLADRTDEINRLIKAFEAESMKFRPLAFSLFYLAQDGPIKNRKFEKPNHVIMLWQYYGILNGADVDNDLVRNLTESDLKWGLRGAELTCMGIIEGEGCELFVRMATRAGSLFDGSEAQIYKSKYVNEIANREKTRSKSGKPTAVVTNDNPLGIWLNYLLYFVSSTAPGRVRAERIDPDPNTLSLLALENLIRTHQPGKAHQANANVAEQKFLVSMSFPGELRRYVSSVVEELRKKLPANSVFYDFDFQAQLARPNLDTLLQDIYRNRSELIVVFLSSKYVEKEWCGLEWRAIRDIIKNKKDDQLMFVRFDEATIPGLFSIDGYIDARTTSSITLIELIMQRINQKESQKKVNPDA